MVTKPNPIEAHSHHEQANVTAQLIFIVVVTGCLPGLCRGRCIGFALQLGLGGTSVGFQIPHDQGGHGVWDLRHHQNLSLGIIIQTWQRIPFRCPTGRCPVTHPLFPKLQPLIIFLFCRSHNAKWVWWPIYNPNTQELETGFPREDGLARLAVLVSSSLN